MCISPNLKWLAIKPANLKRNNHLYKSDDLLWCWVWWVNSSAHQWHQSLQVEGTKYWVPILFLTVPEVFLIGHVLDWREGVAKKWTQPACTVLTSMIYCICMTIHCHCFDCCFMGRQHKGGYIVPNIVIVNLVETNIVIVNLVETNI